MYMLCFEGSQAQVERTLARIEGSSFKSIIYELCSMRWSPFKRSRQTSMLVFAFPYAFHCLCPHTTSCTFPCYSNTFTLFIEFSCGMAGSSAHLLLIALKTLISARGSGIQPAILLTFISFALTHLWVSGSHGPTILFIHSYLLKCPFYNNTYA